jgi:hypothetical protein
VRYLFRSMGSKEEILLRRPAVMAVLASLAICLLAVGCGGGGDSESNSIDKASFVEQANEICKRISNQIQTEVQKIASSQTGSNRTQNDLVLFHKVVIPGFQAELDEIRALGTPSGSRKQLNAFYAAQQKMIDMTKANPSSFSEPDGEKQFEVVELAGTKYGISECPIASVGSS